MSRSKSQIIAETLFVYAILFAFSMIMIIYIFDQNTQMLEERKRAEANRISSDIVDAINTAVIEGDGFSITFTTPPDILGTNYTLNIDDGALLVEWSNHTLSKTILTKNVYGTLKKGTNTVRNENGQIFIE